MFIFPLNYAHLSPTYAREGFRKPSFSAGRPKHWFDLDGARVARTKHPKSQSEFAFEIVTASGEKETFIANSLDDFQSWLNTLQVRLFVVVSLAHYSYKVSIHALLGSSPPLSIAPYPWPFLDRTTLAAACVVSGEIIVCSCVFLLRVSLTCWLASRALARRQRLQ